MKSEGARTSSALPILVWLLFAALPGDLRAQKFGGDYVIGPRDVITLKVFQAPEFDGRFTLSESGIINHPLLDEVELGGLTRSAAERRIKELLEERFFQKGRALVTLEVGEYRSQPIHVIGAVATPGQLAASRPWTLLQAITEVGGVSAGRGSVAHVIRRSRNGLTAQVDVNLDDLLLRGDPKLDLPLQPDDIVNIPEAVDVTIYCMGEVNTPGAIVFSSNEQITLLAAIARAGGLTDRAKRRITIKRQGAGGKVRDIVVNFKDVQNGRAPNLVLQQGDIIQVGTSFL